MSDLNSEIQSRLAEDFKENDFDGYKEYRKEIDPDKLLNMSYNFDPMKLAIDTLFK